MDQKAYDQLMQEKLILEDKPGCILNKPMIYALTSVFLTNVLALIIVTLFMSDGANSMIGVIAMTLAHPLIAAVFVGVPAFGVGLIKSLRERSKYSKGEPSQPNHKKP